MRGQGKLQSDTYFDAWSGTQLQFHYFPYMEGLQSLLRVAYYDAPWKNL